MHELILAWTEAGVLKSQKIQEQQPSKHPGTVRIGRDPTQCDIIITHPTVSGLHIEIFFNQTAQSFYLRNLRPINPPLVDQQSIIEGEISLREGSSICLGQVELKVIAITGTEKTILPTIITPPQPPNNLQINTTKQVIEINIDENRTSGMVADIVNTDYFQQVQQLSQKAKKKPTRNLKKETNQPATNENQIYGSMCLKCNYIAPYKRDLWCTHCGASMATAEKVLIQPKNTNL
jgi:hypothetical protein